MRRYTSIIIIVLVILISVGFASVTTSLIANGVSNVTTNPDDFQVYFSYVYSESGGTAEISSDKHNITYNSKKLTTVGETTSLSFVVTNDSSQYDADVSITYTIEDVVNNKDYSSYFTVTRSSFVNHESMPAKTHTGGIITIRLDKAILEDISLTFNVTLDVRAVERTEEGSGLPDITYGSEEEMMLYSIINDYRINHGLKPYYWDGDLYTAAQTRNLEIQESYSNTRPNGEPYYTANDVKIYGETLSKELMSLDEVLTAWVTNENTYSIVMSDTVEENGESYPPFSAIGCSITNTETNKYISCEYGYRVDL